MDNIYKYDIYKPYAGIEGLKGLSYIPKSERELLVADIQKDYPYYTSDQDLDNVFRNRVYIATYGEEAFNSKNKQDRDKEHYSNVVNTEFLNRFGDSGGNLPSELSSIYDPEAMYTILTYSGNKPIYGGFRTADEIEDIVNQKKEEYKDVAQMRAMVGDAGFISTGADNFNEYDIRNTIMSNNEDILDKALKIQDTNKINKVEPVTFKLIDNAQKAAYYNSDYAKQLETAFDTLMSDGYTDNEGQWHNTFGVYNAFKDKVQLEDFSLSDKIKILSLFESLNSSIPEDATQEQKQQEIIENIEIINRQFKDIVNERTPIGDIAWNTLEGIGTKLASSTLGLYANAKAALLAFSDDPAAANYLQGLDAEGNELPLMDNVKYWNDVDAYGSFSKVEHAQIESNGGISAHKYMRKAGEEFDFWNIGTLVDAGEMVGYGVGSLALDAATMGLFKGVGVIGGNKVFRALTKAATAVTGAAEGTAKAAKVVNFMDGLKDFSQDALRMFIHTIPETGLEASNVYKEVYDQGMQDLEKNLLSKIPDMENKAKKLYLEYLQNNQEKDIEGNPIIKSPDYNSPEYLAFKSQVFNETREDAIKAIEDAALQAYQVEFATKGLANVALDGTFKKYLFTKDINFGKQKNLIDEDFLVENADGTYRKKVGSELIKPISKRVGKNILGGGFEEFTDELWNQGAAAVGYNMVENYYDSMSNPEMEAYINDWFSNMYAWNYAATKSSMDPSTWYQAAVGAISPIVGVGINPISGIISTLNKNATKQDKWSSWIYSPLLREALDIKNQLQTTEQLLNGADGESGLNKIIRDNQDKLKDAASSLRLVEATDKSKTNASTQWKDRFNDALKFVSSVSNLGQLGESSSLYNDYINALQRMAKGIIIQEDGSKYDSSYGEVAVDNGGRAQYTEAQAAANKEIQKNAQTLLDMFESYNVVANTLQRHSKGTNGVSLSNEAFNELLYQTMLSDYASKHLLAAEKQITGRSRVSTNTADAFLSKNGKNKEINNIDTAIQTLKDKIELLKSQSGKKDSPISKYVKKRSTSEAKDRIKELQKRKNALESSLESNDKTITKEEFLNLSPIERYKVISDPKSYGLSNKDIQDLKYNKGDVKEEVDALFEYSASLAASVDRSNNFLKTSLDPRYVEMMNYNSALSTRSQNDFLAQRAHYKIVTANKFRNRLLKNPLKILRNPEQSVLLTADVVDILLNDKQVQKNPVTRQALETFKSKLNYETKLVNVIRNLKGNYSLELKNLVLSSLLKESLGTTSESEMVEAVENWLKANRGDVNVDISIRRIAQEILTNISDVNDIVEIPAQKADPQEPLDLEDISIEESTEVNEQTQQPNTVETPTPTNTPNYTESATEVEDEEQSPTLQELNDATGNRKEVISISDEGLNSNGTPEQQISNVQSGAIVGNTSSVYDPNSLSGNSGPRVLKRRSTSSEEDSYSTFMKWAEVNYFKYQEFIDNELHKVVEKYNPKILFLRPYNKGANHSTGTVAMVIEYTEEMRKDNINLHGGNTITAIDIVDKKEKQYILLGQSFYTDNNPSNFNNFTSESKAPYSAHSDVTGKDTYYVNSNNYTRVKTITSGLIANSRDDLSKNSRSLKSLIEDSNSNPKGLKYSDLVFGVVKPGGIEIVGGLGAKDHTYYSPKNADLSVLGTSLGDVFVYIPSSNGNYIPLYIPSKKLSEIKQESALYATVETQAEILISNTASIGAKKAAAKILSNHLYARGKYKIGVKNDGTFFINDGKRQVTSANNPSLVEIMRLLGNFRINYNNNAFQESYFKLLSDAGALDLDVIALSTFNAQFEVFNSKEEADSNVDTAYTTSTPRESKVQENKETIYVKVQNTRYNKGIDGKWRNTDTGKLIENTLFIEKLDKYVEAFKRGSVTKMNNKSYFVVEDGSLIDTDTTNGIIVYEKTLEEIDVTETLKDRAAEEELNTLNNLKEVEQKAEEKTEPDDRPLEEVMAEVVSPETKKTTTKVEKKTDKSLDNSKIISNFAEILIEKEDLSDGLIEFVTEENYLGEDFTLNDVAKLLVDKGIDLNANPSLDTIKEILKNCR